MVDRFYGYQYDTSPRKLSQQQTPYRNRYSQKVESGKNNDFLDYQKNNNKIKESSNSSSKHKAKEHSKTSEEVYNRMLQRQRLEEKERIQNNEHARINKDKKTLKPRLKMIMMLITGFSVLFAISYQNSLISESFNKKEQYKKEMEALSKTNQQIEVNIENSLNMNNIEQAAKDRLGMQKLNNNQKIYVSLPKQDYVAPATEQIIIEEEMGFFEKLVKGFTNSIKN